MDFHANLPKSLFNFIIVLCIELEMADTSIFRNGGMLIKISEKLQTPPNHMSAFL